MQSTYGLVHYESFLAQYIEMTRVWDLEKVVDRYTEVRWTCTIQKNIFGFPLRVKMSIMIPVQSTFQVEGVLPSSSKQVGAAVVEDKYKPAS